METQTASGATPVDVYARVTANIIEQLKNDIVPWREPWVEAGIPTNFVNHKPYKGINTFILASQKYERNLFISYKQLQGIGGRVKKDEKGHQVIFWDYSQTEGGKKPPILLSYAVFNVAQCENIPDQYIPAIEKTDFDPIASCEEVVRTIPKCPTIKSREQKAYYDPLKDFINMPKPLHFDCPEAYCCALYHQLLHSTGHHSRLNRPDLIQMAEFGSDACSREELTAEIGANFLQSYTGIGDELDKDMAHIQDWIEKLQGDHRLIFSAASAAQKAVDFILNKTEDKGQMEA